MCGLELNYAAFPRRPSASSARIFWSTCMGHMRLFPRRVCKWHRCRLPGRALEKVAGPKQTTNGVWWACSSVCGMGQWQHLARFLGRRLPRPGAGDVLAEGKHIASERTPAPACLFACFSLNAICCRFGLACHFRKDTDEDLWSWALRSSLKCFFTFFSQDPERGSSGSRQTGAYQN